MIPFEKQCVSLDLAKRLKELGVKQESFWAWYETTDRDDAPRLNRFDEYCTVCTLPKQAWEEKYAAFTVAELREMLPDTYYSGRNEFSNYWCSTVKVIDRAFSAQTEADARAKMLIYLLDNELYRV